MITSKYDTDVYKNICKTNVPLKNECLETEVASKEESKEVTIAQRALNFCSGMASGVWTASKNTLKGAAVWTGLHGLASNGHNLNILYNCIFNPDAFKVEGFILMGKQNEFYEIAKELASSFRSQGKEIPDEFNAKKILLASCPKAEFYEQISLITGKAVTPSQEIIRGLGIYVALNPLVEEIFFRGIIQDLLLKRLVKKAVAKMAPQHANKVDSKIYTGVRILLTSAAFAYIQQQNVNTFFQGIGFGVFKESLGLASSIGAHVMNKLVPTLPNYIANC